MEKMINIGPMVQEQLQKVGINSKEELISIGSKKAWLKIQKIDSSACIHRLMALEGAIQDMKKSDLSSEVKDDLRNFYFEHKVSD